ncbi:MAG: type II toxin-antitoxin system RelE/ParE family toxin [Selenomonadaceae bacterium]|nr:type II toxin-antitoxin system RelE/ParE family toxin [Selenomonadaceae bacterium]
MITSFADKETKKVYNQQFSRKLPQAIQRIALRKLMMLDAAERLDDLRIPPSNHLELLHADREGQHSIRINAQYRICFVFDKERGNCSQVEIVDYH